MTASRLTVMFLKLLRGLFWLAILGLAAALPWLVRDWMQETGPAGDRRGEAVAGEGGSGDGAAPGEERAPGLFQRAWAARQERAAAGQRASMVSARSREASARVGPTLQAELAALGLELGRPVFLRIFKDPGELELWMEPRPGDQWVHFKTWPVCRWSGKPGPKLKEGDRQAPEGFYHVSPARMNPKSDYHLSFDLGFPNDYDRHHGRDGSHLMVHGGCFSVGCYAMTDPVIEEVYTLAAAALLAGQPFFRVHAFPFRMTDEKMDALDQSGEWFGFWANLKEGYDYFEFVGRPPEVNVAEGSYHFR